ncbi:hypothetical protein ACFCXT_19880 [Streptomyces vinaceus]|uniref:hypothetical protein n=1 Tax=Streptomyces vinaceus TaxID=1960 RepID=UPI0035DDE056
MVQTKAGARVPDWPWLGGEIDIYTDKTGRHLNTARQRKVQHDEAAHRYWPGHLTDPAQFDSFPVPAQDREKVQIPGC